MLSCLILTGQAASDADGPRHEGKDPLTITNTADLVIPLLLPDPLERANRIVWGFNRGLFTGLVRPTSVAYRFIVRKPLRRGIQNFGRNLNYPGRLVNHLLQGRWSGARDETYRFGCNSVLGLGGFFDVATRLDIPMSEADFGETLGRWGWTPRAYLMLPIYGPSNERDLVGLAGDTASNPLTYLSPYSFDSRRLETYISPYTYTQYAVKYNGLSDSVDQLVRYNRAQMDAYSEIQYAWGFIRDTGPVELEASGPLDPGSLETLQSVFFTPSDPGFPRRGQTGSVKLATTGRRLGFSYWLQPGEAPVVYIVPGLGSHRLSGSTVGLAELVYRHGFSAVCVSSPFNHEFMRQASTAALPAYTPVDAADLQAALSQIDHCLDSLYPGRKGAKALLGFSMGGFHALYIAARNPSRAAFPIQFDRYVAINPPVQLLHSTTVLDEFFQAPLSWPADQRVGNIHSTLRKSAALVQGAPASADSPPFSGVESRFIVGMAFRLILRDTIFTSQARTNQGVLRQPISKLRRQPVYREILRYSFQDYFQKLAVPYYQAMGTADTAEALAIAGDLRIHTSELHANPRVRVIGTRNDFLLAKSDLTWLETTFGPGRLTLTDRGGHLGNLLDPEVHRAIIKALEDLRPGQTGEP